eukprot:6151360-Amphidinium_carterae.1
MWPRLVVPWNLQWSWLFLDVRAKAKAKIRNSDKTRGQQQVRYYSWFIHYVQEHRSTMTPSSTTSLTKKLSTFEADRRRDTEPQRFLNEYSATSRGTLEECSDEALTQALALPEDFE